MFVSEDFPWEIQECRKILRPVMTKARQEKRDAFINVDILILDGKTYTVDNIHAIPASLNPTNTATPQIGDNMKAFFGNIRATWKTINEILNRTKRKKTFLVFFKRW